MTIILDLTVHILTQYFSSHSIGHCVHTLQGHIGVVRCVHLVGDRLISAGDCKKVMVWNTKVTNYLVSHGQTAFFPTHTQKNTSGLATRD